MSGTAPPASRPPPQPSRPGLVERLRAAPTPARLRALLYAVWAAAAILFLVGEGALGSARRALRIVGKESAPSIIAAQEIGAALADLDANAGNSLLGSAARQASAVEGFEKRRVHVTHSLVSAAENITFGDDERAPILAMFDGLGRYLELVAEARHLRTLEASQPSARRRDDAVRVYETASDLMHQKVLPAADALDETNRRHLDAAYRAQQRVSGVTEAGAVGGGVLLVAVLISGQVFLARRTRRIFNVPLAGATLVAIAFTGYLVTRIHGARAELTVATQDAFASIHTLFRARALASDANGDETRYLLGGERAGSFERAYREKMQRLLSDPRVDLPTLERRPFAPGISGLLADEMRNVTFLGEREAAIKMVLAFVAYDRVDAQVRALEALGLHDRAVELCVGAGSDQSNATFERFDRALRAVADINHVEFDAAITRGMRRLDVATGLAPVASLAVALLALLGIRPRLREYAA